MSTPNRRARLTPASEISTKAWKAEQYDVIDAVRDVLPDEWRVLPDGRSTAKAIANRAAERYEDRQEQP